MTLCIGGRQARCPDRGASVAIASNALMANALSPEWPPDRVRTEYGSARARIA